VDTTDVFNGQDSPAFQLAAVASNIGMQAFKIWNFMDRLEAMSVLLAAARTGCLSKASRKLCQPLATVSRKVSELERYLKAELLVRTAKGLEMTPVGRSYVAGARAVLEQVTEIERAASGEYLEPKGELVVSAPVMFGRLQALSAVMQSLHALPDVAVRLLFTDSFTHFLADQVDVALRIGHLPDSRLIATSLGSEGPWDWKASWLSTRTASTRRETHRRLEQAPHQSRPGILVGFYRDKKLIYTARVRAGLVPATRREVFAQTKHLEDKPVPVRESAGDE
jgi:DNA-binding transcriptional LysR family regulator